MRFFSVTILALSLSALNAFASELDGSWAAVSSQCGSAPAQPLSFPVTFIAQGESLTLNMNLTSMIPGCSIVGKGQIQVTGNTVVTKALTVTQAPACGELEITTTEDSTSTFEISGSTLKMFSPNVSGCTGATKTDTYKRL